MTDRWYVRCTHAHLTACNAIPAFPGRDTVAFLALGVYEITNTCLLGGTEKEKLSFIVSTHTMCAPCNHSMDNGIARKKMQVFRGADAASRSLHTLLKEMSCLSSLANSH